MRVQCGVAPVVRAAHGHAGIDRADGAVAISDAIHGPGDGRICQASNGRRCQYCATLIYRAVDTRISSRVGKGDDRVAAGRLHRHRRAGAAGAAGRAGGGHRVAARGSRRRVGDGIAAAGDRAHRAAAARHPVHRPGDRRVAGAAHRGGDGHRPARVEGRAGRAGVVTVTAGASTLIAAEADLVLSAALVATRVCDPAAAGAV